ncbi:MAG TPA: hypothetical protein PKK48_05660 [Phycisphaerae bacterium]|nr:hypothetical protein [Phycisphaerae bacterium]
MSKKIYVGFGFGPIQSGLFVYEAFRSGNFDRLVVAEIDQGMVDAVRAAGNRYMLNIALADRIETVAVEGVELYNPNVAEDREKLVQAITEADELGTALPSVKFYSLGDSCAAKLFAEGVNRRVEPMNTVFYTAENNNRAAEYFLEAVSPLIRSEHLAKFQALNTVIGKMSGIITEPKEIAELGIAKMAPASPKAILVEEFNRILITRISLDGFKRGISVLIEKDDLIPFEEAKLYGHNAIHAMMAYMGEEKGYVTMSQLAADRQILSLARKAFLEDSGRPLCKKYASLGDELFTEAGYRAYADDLLVRMVNPYLTDLISRVGRDHLRKLSQSDRLFGTMRLAIEQGFTPATIALGAAAGIRSMIRRQNEINPKPVNLPAKCEDLTRESMAALLTEIWGDCNDDIAKKIIDITWKAYTA